MSLKVGQIQIRKHRFSFLKHVEGQSLSCHPPGPPLGSLQDMGEVLSSSLRVGQVTELLVTCAPGFN